MRQKVAYDSRSFNYSMPKEKSIEVIGGRISMKSKSFYKVRKKRLGNLILTAIWATVFLEVSALLNVRDFPKLQSCRILQNLLREFYLC